MNPTHSNGRQLAASALAASALAAAAIVGNSAQAAPVNVLNAAGTTLMGVDGIEFNGNAYNVRFVDGTCEALFGGCSANTNSFLFSTQGSAIEASNALGAALFGQALPAAINGVTLSESVSALFTPFGSVGANAWAQGLEFRSTSNTNAFLNGPFTLSGGVYGFGSSVNTVSLQKYAFASWSLVGPVGSNQDVPEPGSLALAAVGLGVAFLAAGKTRRRRPA